MTEEIYNEYMKRLDAEFQDFEIDMCSFSSETIFARAGEILNMKHAYDYLRSQDIPDDELDYVMQAMNPLHAVADTRKAFDLETYQENPIALTVCDIFEKKRFADPGIEKYTDRVPIRFHKKTGSLDEILRLPRNREDDRFVVEKIVELSSKDFDRFAKNLLAPMPFLPFGDDTYKMLDDGAWHCLLVHDAEKNRGMLVDSSGFDYARYAAFVQDTRELDFQNIPVEECTLPQRTRQRKPKPKHRER